MSEKTSFFEKFNTLTDEFYSGHISVPVYRTVSGSMGSYAQRGGRDGMVRLRFAGGKITKDKLGFICKCIANYNPSRIHITTCQSLQLHGLGSFAIKTIVGNTPSADIHTFGSGGDFPRNITATPLSGIAESACVDLTPYAQAVENHLLGLSEPGKLPGKLTMGFSYAYENMALNAAKDMDFVYAPDGTFHVYSGGSPGTAPVPGIWIDGSVDPPDVLAYADALFRMYSELGNFRDRKNARVRHLRADLGDERFAEELLSRARKNLSDASIPKTVFFDKGIEKTGDRSLPASDVPKAQRQNGLFYVPYHPAGGDISPDKVLMLERLVSCMDDVEIRLSPDQTMYVVNLTGREADRVASLLSDRSPTAFSSSVCCVGSTLCQSGLRDSRDLLEKLISMEKENGFADGILPRISISGCPKACVSCRIGTITLCGTSAIGGKPAFRMCINGRRAADDGGRNEEIGDLKETDIPKFFESIGRAVEQSGSESFMEWYMSDPDSLMKIGADTIYPIRR